MQPAVFSGLTVRKTLVASVEFSPFKCTSCASEWLVA